MLQKFGNELSAKLRAGLNLYLWALAQDEKFRDFIQKSRLKNIFTKDTRKKKILAPRATISPNSGPGQTRIASLSSIKISLHMKANVS